MKAPLFCLIVSFFLAICLYAQSTPVPATPAPTVFIPTSAAEIIANPDATLSIVTKWTEVIGLIAALLSALVIKIMSDISNVKNQQKQQVDSHNALAASVTNLALQTPPPTANSQTNAIVGLILIPFLLTSLLFSGCASDGTLTPKGQIAISNATQIASLALTTYLGYETAKGSGKVTPAQIATLAQNDLSGIAALAQASIGKTPTEAQLATGAVNTVPASAVVAALPNIPITQTTVDKLFAAAAVTK